MTVEKEIKESFTERTLPRIYYLTEPISLGMEQETIEIEGLGLYPCKDYAFRIPVKAQLEVKANAMLVDNATLEKEIRKLVELLKSSSEREEEKSKEIKELKDQVQESKNTLKRYESYVLQISGLLAPLLEKQLTFEKFEEYEKQCREAEEAEADNWDY